jgi:hypothetical protein
MKTYHAVLVKVEELSGFRPSSTATYKFIDPYRWILGTDIADSRGLLIYELLY